MLHIDGLSKTYGKKMILDNISLSVEAGEIIGLVGENGAGKSTLLKILATLQLPAQGDIILNKMSYQSQRKSVRKNIGFVPQEIAIWDDLTVEENMVFFGKLSWKHKSNAQLKQLCLDMNLTKWKAPVKTLSGGMKRKLNLAISLIHDPHLLLLDEPTVGIDLKSRKEIGTYLKNQANHGRTIIYTSHDMDEIIHLCDRVLCIGNDPFYRDILDDAGKVIVRM
jgi:ABC-2 type transport system ATP-binding protein